MKDKASRAVSNIPLNLRAAFDSAASEGRNEVAVGSCLPNCILSAPHVAPCEPCCEMRPVGSDKVHQDDCPVYLVLLRTSETEKGTVEGSGPHGGHYGGADNPYEVIKVIEAWGLGFHLSTAVKYIARVDQKGTPIQDLEKALFYLNRELENRRKQG